MLYPFMSFDCKSQETRVIILGLYNPSYQGFKFTSHLIFKKKSLVFVTDSFQKSSYRIRYKTSGCVFSHIEIFIIAHSPLVIALASVDLEMGEKDKIVIEL